MKSQIVLSLLSVAGLVAAQLNGPAAAGLHGAGHAKAERAIAGGQRRHHARAGSTATLALGRGGKAASTPTLGLNRAPLHRTTSSSSSTTLALGRSTSSSKTTSTFTHSTSTSTSTSATTTSTGPVLKKGVSYNTVNNTVPFAGNVGWAYDWYSDPSGTLPVGVEFAPMLWSNASDLTSIWDAKVKAAIKNRETHLLGFNEPDLSTQSDMTTDAAVAAWKKWMEPYAGQIKLVAPAITNGGAPSGVAWMQEFLAKCTGCHIDAIAMHWYDAAWNVGYFTGYFTDAIATFSPRPIWITEFRGSGTAAEQVTFINTVVPWLNNHTAIERYAIFGNYDGPADEGNMITGGKLNSVGIAYRDAK